MAKQTRARLTSPFLISIADLFLGASATLLCAIVMTAAPAAPKIPRVVDLLLECKRGTDGHWLVAASGNASNFSRTSNNSRFHPYDESSFQLASAWLSGLKSETFLVRVGVLARQDEMPCFLELDTLVAQHDRDLSMRGTIAPAVSLVLIPRRRQ
jgi:hypothetical protein